MRSNQIADHVISMLPPNTRVLLRHPNQHTGHHLRRRAVKHGDKKIILSKGVNHNTLSALTTKVTLAKTNKLIKSNMLKEATHDKINIFSYTIFFRMY